MKNIVNIIIQALGTEKVKKEVGNISEGFKRLNASCKDLTNSFIKAQLAVEGLLAGLGGIRGIISSFKDAASTAENYRVRLNTLLDSVQEGNRLFKEMSRFASGVSFKYEEIMGAATALAGVMEAGVDEIQRWMPIIADLAAVSGLSIEETTSQVIRMYSAGAQAADMFRERGVLAMLGFQAGVSYTAEETRKRLIEAWEDPASKFRGASQRLAATWDGLMSMLADKWFQFRNAVMQSGVFEWLKSALDLLNRHLTASGKNMQAVAKRVGKTAVVVAEGVVKAVGLVGDAFYGLKLIWLALEVAFYKFALMIWKGLHAIRKGTTALVEKLNIGGIFDKYLRNSRRIFIEQEMIIHQLKRDLTGAQQALEAAASKGVLPYLTKAEQLIERIRANIKNLKELEVKGLPATGHKATAGAEYSPEQAKEIQKRFDEYYRARQWLTDRLNKLTLSEFDYRRAKLLQEYQERAKVLGWTEELYQALKADLARIDEEETEKTIQELQKQKQARIQALETIKNFSGQYHLFRLQQLEEIAAEMRKAGIAEVEIERWKAEELKNLQRQQYRFQIEHAERFKEALKAKFDLMSLEVKGTFQAMAEAIDSTFQGLKQSLSRFFFDAIRGKLKSLGDYVVSFLEAVARAVSNFLAQQMAGAVVNYVASSFGGGFSSSGGIDLYYNFGAGAPRHHRGGYVVPRFHWGGLAHDEVPAILQRGEYVVSRRGVEFLDRINRGIPPGDVNVVVNVENRTSQPVNAKVGTVRFDGRQYITSIILEDIETNGPIAQAILRGR